MKAKMTKLCLLFILLCSLPVFYSCSDEADAFYLYEYWEVMLDPKPPISETSLPITGGTKLGIKGGVAPYTAEIADGQILRILSISVHMEIRKREMKFWKI